MLDFNANDYVCAAIGGVVGGGIGGLIGWFGIAFRDRRRARQEKKTPIDSQSYKRLLQCYSYKSMLQPDGKLGLLRHHVDELEKKDRGEWKEIEASLKKAFYDTKNKAVH